MWAVRVIYLFILSATAAAAHALVVVVVLQRRLVAFSLSISLSLSLALCSGLPRGNRPSDGRDAAPPPRRSVSLALLRAYTCVYNYTCIYTRRLGSPRFWENEPRGSLVGSPFSLSLSLSSQERDGASLRGEIQDALFFLFLTTFPRRRFFFSVFFPSSTIRRRRRCGSLPPRAFSPPRGPVDVSACCVYNIRS